MSAKVRDAAADSKAAAVIKVYALFVVYEPQHSGKLNLILFYFFFLLNCLINFCLSHFGGLFECKVKEDDAVRFGHLKKNKWEKKIKKAKGRNIWLVIFTYETSALQGLRLEGCWLESRAITGTTTLPAHPLCPLLFTRVFQKNKTAKTIARIANS